MAPDGSPRFMVVAYSGHRRLSDPGAAAEAIEVVIDRLEAIAAQQGSIIVGVGSAAVGADTIVLESLKRRGFANLLKLPFSENVFEAESPEEQRQRCLHLIETSTAIEYAPHGLSENQAYLEAGLQTIEPADVLVAVWDGEAARGQGGTAEIVSAAEGIDLPVVRVDPASGEVSWPRVFATRAMADSPAATASVRDASAAFDRHALDRLFDALDNAAEPHARKARFLLFRIILLHLIASALSIIAVMAELEEPIEHALAVFVVGALLWALVLATAQRSRSRVWLDTRYRAELCRSFRAIWKIRRDALPKLSHPATSEAMQRFHRDLELAWRLRAGDAVNLEEARQEYLHERLVHQKEWLADKGRKASASTNRNHRIGVVTTIGAIISGGASFVLGLADLHGAVYDWILALSIVLPLVAAAIFSFSVSQDLTRRATRYTELAERLEVLEKRVRISATWPSLGRAIAETEALLLNELGEWHAMMRFAGRPH